MEFANIVKLAVDAYKGHPEKYSVAQSQEALREALIELNGGSSKLDYRAIRDGKCNGMFALIEEILSQTVMESLLANDFFNALVDYRNIKLGDQNIFVIENSTLFVVDDTAPGNQGVRRQRIESFNEVAIKTSVKTVRIYEELDRVLAGRVDFNHLIDLVARSFQQRILMDIYTLWANVTAADLGGSVYFPAAGTYDPEVLLDLIAHVEAAADGKQAMILGTKKALRGLEEHIQSDSSKEEIHNLGYLGKFYGTPVMAIPQRHKAGTTQFVFDDDVLTIIAGDEKPIKFVYEGDPFIVNKEPADNADLTYEYFVLERWGLGLVMANGNCGIGRYEMQ